PAADGHEPVPVRKRHRPEEDGVHQRERRRVEPDAKRQCRHHGGREPPLAHDESERETHVLHGRLNPPTRGKLHPAEDPPASGARVHRVIRATWAGVNAAAYWRSRRTLTFSPRILAFFSAAAMRLARGSATWTSE